MASCANCGTTILFGGVYDGTDRYCSDRCRVAAPSDLLRTIRSVPDEVVYNRAEELMRGPCDSCNTEGRVCNLYRFHWVWSFAVITRFGSKGMIVCSSCRRKQASIDFLGSFLLGWWAFPFGPIVTIDRLIRNGAKIVLPQRRTPTYDLLQHARSDVGYRSYRDWQSQRTNENSPL